MASSASSQASESMTAVVAATLNNGIGLNGGLPWRLTNEMKYFARVTTGENLPEGKMNALIMGRKTWQGIPAKYRPLKSRKNLVVSRAGIELSEEAATSVHSSLGEAVKASSERDVHRTFLIGGAQLYNLSLSSSTSTSSAEDTADEPKVDRVLLTRVLSPFECDTFLDPFTESREWRLCTHRELCEWVGWEVQEGEIEEKGIRYRFEMWVRV